MTKRLLLSVLCLFSLSLAALGQPTPWFLSPDGGVYRALLGGPLQRVGLGSATNFAVSAQGQTVWAVGTDSRVWTAGPDGRWQPLQGNATALKIQIGAGKVYILGVDGGVYRLDGRDWKRMGLVRGQELAVSPQGQVGIVGLDNGVYLLQGTSWNRFGDGTARQISWPR